MNMAAIIAQVTQLANTVAQATQYGVVPDIVKIGGKVIDLIDDLQAEHPTQDQALAQRTMQEARAQLADRVKAHAESTAQTLRGKD